MFYHPSFFPQIPADHKSIEFWPICSMASKDTVSIRTDSGGKVDPRDFLQSLRPLIIQFFCGLVLKPQTRGKSVFLNKLAASVKKSMERRNLEILFFWMHINPNPSFNLLWLWEWFLFEFCMKIYTTCKSLFLLFSVSPIFGLAFLSHQLFLHIFYLQNIPWSCHVVLTTATATSGVIPVSPNILLLLISFKNHMTNELPWRQFTIIRTIHGATRFKLRWSVVLFAETFFH